MQNWTIQTDTCKQCGACADVCPNRILQKDEAGKMFFRPDRLWACFSCGHCMTVCPTESVLVPGLAYDRDFYVQPRPGDQAEQAFADLIASRRSVRSFQDRPVPHALLEKIVRAVQYAPIGFTPVKTELVVVADPQVIRQALPQMTEMYENLVKMMANPAARFFIRRQAGASKFAMLKSHVIPLMKSRLPDLRSGKEDTITRRAPAMILFHADRASQGYRAEIDIAITYAMLAAQSLGLGATMIDLIPPVIERSQALRAMFKIPPANEVVAAMILGFPRHRILRGIRRECKSVTWIQGEADA